MNLTDTYSTINLSISVSQHVYKGPTEPCHIRNGFGIEQWYKESPQKYQGTFYNDALHKYGIYEWNYNKQKYVYEGKIYANNMDGYGRLSYPDGKSFEGLFMYNQRFGPGVLTYSNGSQDVGLWNGTNLVRLSTKIDQENLPNLAKSLSAKAYLMQYKKLISVSPRTFSPAKEILQEFGASDQVINNRHKLCNKYIRNDSSLFFDFDNYDNAYFSDEQQFVDVITQFENGVPKLEQKIVTDILAWNNEEESILILKHTFLNRNFEITLSYNIDDILTGQRNNFAEPGFLENICREFLICCNTGDHKRISQLITQYDINPNVCDLIGNYGIHFAVSNNHTLAIKNLVNFGANIDILNDEGLTPLIIAILQYISVKENVRDWEKAFLPSISPDVTQEIWRPYISQSCDNLDNQTYILDLECKHPLELTDKKLKSPRGKNRSQLSSKDDKSKSNARMAKSLANEIQINFFEDELYKIYTTILTLLQYGANLNYGEVPLPPLILAIFTKDQNIIYDLIKYGADCNITTAYQDGSLTPLHIVTALKVTPDLIEVAKILLQNGSKPNPKANTDHWLGEKYIIDSENICIDEGKTPLHVLTMRYDFQDENDDLFGILYETLVENGSDPNIFYLGHNCLTLAILRGNLNMMNKILQSYKVDPNQLLGCNMGVALTVLILKKYKHILPLETCKEVYKILNNYNANPFVKIPNFGNTIEFCDAVNLEENTKKEVKKKDLHLNVIKLLYDNAEQVLNRHIMGHVIKCLYEYRIECDFAHEIFDQMVNFVDANDTLKILQILLDHDLITYNVNCFSALVNYVESKTRSKKQKKKKNMLDSSTKFAKLIEEMFKQELPNTEIKVPIPEIDPDDAKYIVCYNCYKESGKTLVLCPKCELVYFCSEECNKLNLKRNTKHKCKGIFYNAELKNMLARQAAGITYQTKMFQLRKYRDMFLSDPDHEFDIKYAFSSTISKLFSRSKHKSSKLKSKKEKDSETGFKKKRRKLDDDSEDDEGDADNKRKIKKKKSNKSSETEVKKREGKKKKEPGQSKDKDREPSEKRDRSKSKNKEGRKKRERSNIDTDTTKRKSRSKTRQDKSKSKKDISKTRKDTSKDKAKNKKDKQKDISKTRDKSKNKSKTRKDKSRIREDKPKDKSKTKKAKSGDRASSHKSRRDKSKPKTRGKSPQRKSPSQEIKSRQPRKSSKTRETDQPRDKTPLNKYTKDFKKIERATLAEKYKGLTSNLSEFLQIMDLSNSLLPCCLLINGQLYYKFDKTTYCGLTYSNV